MIWLLRNWRLAGFGLLVLAFGLYVGALKLQMHSMSSRIDQLEAETGRQSVALAERDALLETQNGYIQAWKAAAEKNVELRRAAEKRAFELAKAADRQEIPKPPAATPDNCQVRDAWLRSQLNDLLWPAR